jgi:hypothetical protein
MKTRASVFLSVPALLSLTGCCPQKTISADAIAGPLNRVSDRHDGYAEKDPDLDEVERRIYLRDTELLRQVLEESGLSE